MTTANQVLMIVGDDRRLITCDLNHLINLTQCAQCTKPKLKFNEVELSNLRGFHVLQVRFYINFFPLTFFRIRFFK